MVIAILHFIADKFWVFFLFWACLHHTYIWGGKYSYIDVMFRFKILDEIRNEFKPKLEVKNLGDKIYNFKQYLNFYLSFLLIGGAYISFYIGLFGIILKVIFKIIEKGN